MMISPFLVFERSWIIDMYTEPFSFKDYLWRGIDAFVHASSRAKDSLLIGSNRAIEKLDYWQLEKRLERLYVKLGQLTYAQLVKSIDVPSAKDDMAGLIDEISILKTDLALKKTIKLP